MNNRTKKVIIFSLSILSFSFVRPLTADTQVTPDAFVQQMYNEVIESKGPSPVMQYVNWTQAFETAKTEGWAQPNWKSPREMAGEFAKSYGRHGAMVNFLENSAKKFSNPFTSDRILWSDFEFGLDNTKKSEETVRKLFATASLKIEKVEAKDSDAVVILNFIANGGSATHKLKLVKKGNSWQIVDPRFGSLFFELG